MFIGEAALCLSTQDADVGCIRFHEDEDFQRWDGAVGVAFLSEVDAAGRITQDFDQHNRLLLVVIGIGIPTADHHGIRVVEAEVVGEFDANFRVAVERSARFPAQLRMESGKSISRDRIVPIGATGHRMDGTRDVLVFFAGGVLALEVICDGDQAGSSNRRHTVEST